MTAPLVIAYLVLAAAATLQALLTALQTWEHCRRARQALRQLDGHQPSGRALVIVPCKGDDVGLEANLRGLYEQDYADYEVAWVVEDASDPACAVIRRLMAEYPQRTARLVVAGRSSESGQKVHNLTAVTTGLDRQVEYLAMLDSDARPAPHWLRLAVARLGRRGVGATSGYRWFIPARPSLAADVLSSINLGVLAMMTRKNHYLLWGGAWAIRRETFERLGLPGAWQGVVSDDLAAARLLRRARLYVRFEPACVVASPLDCTWPTMFSFLRRQYLLARLYVPGWWLMALVTSSLRMAAWLASLALLAAGSDRSGVAPWWPGLALAAMYALGVFRGLTMQRLGRVYFPRRTAEMRRPARVDIWLTPVTAAMQWAGLVVSMFGHELRWRGIQYHLSADGRVRCIMRREN